MKNRTLLTYLILTFSSIASASKTPETLAMVYQEQLNNGNIEQALAYWLPRKAAQFKKDNGLVLSQLFGDIEIIKNTINGSCNNSSCKVFAQFKNNDNELQQVIYTFEGVNNLKLSNVQTHGYRYGGS
ncbi:hypothetical protein [Agaribacter flavus]|uniref:DUF3887 domain-containing protein n=1 Tax=Agaribacter flavus TaxID=1902781 RepID=A0ABV7FLS9_9ALTE